MASVTFVTSLGGDGSTVTDDANVNTGLANGGHRLRFVPSLSQVISCMNGALSQASSQVSAATVQAGYALTYANQAAASAATAINAPGTQATSTSTLTVAMGFASLTLVQTGKTFTVGQYVQIVSTANTANWMIGAITAYNATSGAMTINTTAIGGSGSATAWSISPSTPPMLPAQSGNSGLALFTDGSTASWGQVFPAQSGNGGKALVTDGTNVTWTTVYPSQAGNSGKSLVSDGATAAWVGTSCRQFFLSQS
jgi:hypothetical protein